MATQTGRQRQGRYLALSMVVLLMAHAGCGKARTPDRWIIPEGHRGWIKIDYLVKSAPELPIQDGHRIIRFPDSGYLQTSSAQLDGWASDEFLMESPEHRTAMARTISGQGGNLWDGASEAEIVAGANGTFQTTSRFLSQCYFVGAEQHYKNSDDCRSRKWPIVEDNQRVPLSK